MLGAGIEPAGQPPDGEGFHPGWKVVLEIELWLFWRGFAHGLGSGDERGGGVGNGGF